MLGVWLVTNQINLYIRFGLGAGRENSLLSLQMLNRRNYCKHTAEINIVLYSTLLLLTQIIALHSFLSYLKPFPSSLKTENSGYCDRSYHFTNVLWVVYMEWKIIKLVFTWSVCLFSPERHRQRNIRATLTLVSWKTRLSYSDLLETSYKREAWPNSLWRKWESCCKHQQISFRQEANVEVQKIVRLSNHCYSKSN